jgi:tetratricopeptide (TPR) repeat protein
MSRLASSLLLVALIAVAYGNSLRNELVFDELMFVERDPRVHQLAVGRIFREALWSEGEKDHRIHQYYRPLQLLPLALSYRFFGKAAWPSHLLNLVVHLGNCLLVLGIFRVLGGQAPFAGTARRVLRTKGACPLLATAFFAVHPGYSEAVLWVSDIAGLGAAFCILASLRLHLSPRRDRWYGWIGAPLLLLGGLWFKESGILAVVLVVLYDLVAAPDRGLRRVWQLRWRYLVLVPPFTFYFALRLNALGGALPGMDTVALSRADLWINAVALLPKYVATFVWPFSLNMYHDFDAVHGVANRSFWYGVAILVGGGSVVVATFRSHRVAAFGTLWALVAAAPHLLIRWPQLNVFAERYLYLPSVGIFLVIGYVGSRLWRGERDPESRRSLIPRGLVLAVLTIFVLVDWQRTKDWHDEESIYGKTLAQSTRAEIIRTNLAVRYLHEKRYDEGIALLEPLLAINPEWHETRHNLGLLYMGKGETAQAIAAFDAARRRDPFKGATLLNLGYLHDREGRREEAVKSYIELTGREPDNAAAWYNLAVVAFEESQFRNAHFAAEQVLKVSPDDRQAEALLQRIEARDAGQGKADVSATRSRCGEAKRLLDAKRPNDAILTLEMAAWLDEASPLPHHYLSNIYYLSGRLQKALEEKSAALERAPRNQLYKKNLAVLQRALAEQESSVPSD